ncbi:phenoloxidase 1-like [Panulirus ornatus]|uniref:phenoloxidase 1-like n=1 Tax=Panulirus ornatus TaxID=150431 RepID=UPI003A8B532C
MSDLQRKLLYLFEQPSEPLDKPRDEGAIVFSFGGRAPAPSSRFGKPPTIIDVPKRPETDLAQLGTATSVPRGTPFSIFLDHHRQAAKDLYDAFMKTKGAEDLMEFAASVHDNINEEVYIYALASTIFNKKELQNVQLPTFLEIFPDKFIPENELMRTYVRAMNISPDEKTLKVTHGPDFATTTQKPEHRVSYWREDYGINTHHWHWHLAYPLAMDVTRDRKGELFYYMHQQMLARYDMERLSVKINRVEPLENWRVPIPDGYFSKLTINNSGQAWGTRQDNTLLKDVRRTDFGDEVIHITDLELWRSRIFDAIHQGYVINRKGERVSLSDDVTTGKRGIDILGDALEADRTLSINYPYYGNLHNMGHVLISVAHDPDFSHKEDMGVMGNTATAMRDPVFYRWHKFIDEIFQEYKMTQERYTHEDLSFPGIVIERVNVLRQDNKDLVTGWTKRELEMSRGLDFNSPVPVVLELAHMDHQPFEYHLQVTNNNQTEKQVTVRIFLAPKHNITGLEMTFMEQRLLWAEMDKFTVNLKIGSNHIVRLSKDSSVTSPPEYTFKDLLKQTEERNPICGCGWPHHMLLPRGTPSGMDFQVFFMLTDWEKDKVKTSEESPSKRCNYAVSFCGILDEKFPDSKPMGFPFDRRPPQQLMNRSIDKTQDLDVLDNIKLHDVKITFLNKDLNE